MDRETIPKQAEGDCTIDSSRRNGSPKVVISRSEWNENDNVPHFCYWATIDGKEVELEMVARNDGFTDCKDFVAWFDTALNKQKPDEEGWRHLELAIIHFSSFRYQPK